MKIEIRALNSSSPQHTIDNRRWGEVFSAIIRHNRRLDHATLKTHESEKRCEMAARNKINGKSVDSQPTIRGVVRIESAIISRPTLERSLFAAFSLRFGPIIHIRPISSHVCLPCSAENIRRASGGTHRRSKRKVFFSWPFSKCNSRAASHEMGMGRMMWKTRAQRRQKRNLLENFLSFSSWLIEVMWIIQRKKCHRLNLRSSLVNLMSPKICFSSSKICAIFYYIIPSFSSLNFFLLLQSTRKFLTFFSLNLTSSSGPSAHRVHSRSQLKRNKKCCSLASKSIKIDFSFFYFFSHAKPSDGMRWSRGHHKLETH